MLPCFVQLYFAHHLSARVWWGSSQGDHGHGEQLTPWSRASHVLRGPDLVTDWPPASGSRGRSSLMTKQKTARARPDSARMKPRQPQPVSPGARELHNKSNVITFTPPLTVHTRHCGVFKICLSAVLVQKSCFLFDRNRWDVYSRNKHCVLKGQFIPLQIQYVKELQISLCLTGPHWYTYSNFRVFHNSTLFSKY